MVQAVNHDAGHGSIIVQAAAHVWVLPREALAPPGAGDPPRQLGGPKCAARLVQVVVEVGLAPQKDTTVLYRLVGFNVYTVPPTWLSWSMICREGLANGS